GLLYQESAQSMQSVLTNPKSTKKMVHDALADIHDAPEAAPLTRFLGELDHFVDSGAMSSTTSSTANSGGGWRPVEIRTREVGADDKAGPRSGFEVSFVQ